jgi:hypothetical protein
MTGKKYVGHFLGATAFLLLCCITTVVVFDPFYHYHNVKFGLAPVQTDKEYQTTGVIDHFVYNSMLVGSSSARSINSSTLDARLGTVTIKAIGDSASSAYLLYCLNRAYKRQELMRVYYGLDVFSFYYESDNDGIYGEIEYYANNNPFDDIHYLLNGDVIFTRIPVMFRETKNGYDPGLAYNINQFLPCGEEQVYNSYYPIDWSYREDLGADYMKETVEENLQNLENLVAAHPDTQFDFFLPPYSVMWWVKARQSGKMDSYQRTLKSACKRLLKYDNVTIYRTNFNEESFITDFDNFMDYVHAGFSVTEWMGQEIGGSEDILTYDNYEAAVDQIGIITDNFIQQKISEENAGEM